VLLVVLLQATVQHSADDRIQMRSCHYCVILIYHGLQLDCFEDYGHGTMVASIISTANGLAKAAKLGSYRVFGCGGSTTDDVILRAVDRAIRDGCDVITLRPWPPALLATLTR